MAKDKIELSFKDVFSPENSINIDCNIKYNITFGLITIKCNKCQKIIQSPSNHDWIELNGNTSNSIFNIISRHECP